MPSHLLSFTLRGFVVRCIAATAFMVVGAAVAESAQLKTRGAADKRVVLDIVAKPSLTDTSSVSIIDNGVAVPTETLLPPSPKDGGGGTGQLLLVVDAVNCSFQDVTRSEEAIDAFLRSKETLPQLTTIVILSDTLSQQSAGGTPSQGGSTTSLRERQLLAHRIPASRDPVALIHALDSYKVGLHRILESQSGPGQAEKVQLSLQALSFLAQAEASEPGPKVVLWISSGWPFLSKSNARSSEQLFDSIVYFSDLLRSARVLLYAISPEGVTSQDHSAETEAFLLSSRPSSIQANGHAPNIPIETSPNYYKQFLMGVRDGKGSNPNDLALQVLAYQSGGLVMQQNNDLKAQITQCAADAQNISSFAYDIESHNNEVTYHAVEVKRRGGAGTVRTRTGYYAR